MKISKNISVTAFAFVLFFCAATGFAAPNILNYQGTLTDNSGNPVNGSKTMVFRVYDAAAGGTALWSSSSMTVNVQNGLFNVALEGFSSTLFSGDSRYLEVVVAGETQIPRKRLASVPYAINAGSASSSGIPAGVIVMWSGSTTQIPQGWTLCNGQNGTPDLRDRFIVGAGNTYAVGNKDGGANSHNLSHSHTVNNHTHEVVGESPGTNGSGDHTHHIDVQFYNCIGDCIDSRDKGSDDTGSDSHGHHLITDTWGGGNHSHTVNFHNHGGATGGSAPATNSQLSAIDNRPPFYALCFIMKLP